MEQGIFEELELSRALQIVAEYFPKKVVLSTSFGQEDQVILDAIWKNKIPIRVFTLDTGRLFPETYELMDRTRTRYEKTFETYFPDKNQVEVYVREKGFNAFYESVENRKECCAIRKIDGIKRALKNTEVWITGLRAEQSENRADLTMWEYDSNYKLYKYNPLIYWNLKQVEDYLKDNNVPQNTLHTRGFASIGCQPCTRPIEQDEHPRAGRWWWEASHKECGLHSENKT